MHRRNGNLYIQDWLINNSYDYAKLEAYYSITANFHPSDDRVILNYSQIDSPKNSPIVQECRGLVLDRNTGKIIAKGFNRFFNYGECDTDKNFDFEGCTATHKEDGSIILLYYYNGEWRVNTRNSYADGYVVDGVMTWRQLFDEALNQVWKKTYGDNVKYPYIHRLDKSCTYVLELCSRYNKVVKDYPNPKLFLLSIFLNDGKEFSEDFITSEAAYLGLSRPKYVTLKNVLEATAYIGNLSKDDPTFEGLVLRSKDGERVKIKSQTYVALHRLCNNHQLTVERVYDIVSTGEISEMVTYFPEFAQIFERGLEYYNQIIEQGKELYTRNNHLESQKDFALAVKNSPFAALAFALRKYGSIETDTVRRLFEKNFKL
jgi:tRNA splicing ligase